MKEAGERRSPTLPLVPNFRDHWHDNSVETPDGVLTWTEFADNHGVFIGCTRQDGRPIAGAEAHRILVELDHPAGRLDYVGSEARIRPWI